MPQSDRAVVGNASDKAFFPVKSIRVNYKTLRILESEDVFLLDYAEGTHAGLVSVWSMSLY